MSDYAFKQLKQVGAEPVLLPAMGGLVTGLTALAYPEVLYQGFGNVNAVLDVHGQTYTAWLLSQIVVAKVFATAVCRGSGLVGGLYAPSIFTGAPALPAALLSSTSIFLANGFCGARFCSRPQQNGLARPAHAWLHACPSLTGAESADAHQCVPILATGMHSADLCSI